MKLTEAEIRKLAISSIEELGNKATPRLVKESVAKTIEKLERDNGIASYPSLQSDRVFLIAFGFNRPNVAAKITGSLSESKCNIQDVIRKIMGDFFMLALLIDISNSAKNVDQIQQDMNTIAAELGIKIHIHHENSLR